MKPVFRRRIPLSPVDLEGHINPFPAGEFAELRSCVKFERERECVCACVRACVRVANVIVKRPEPPHCVVDGRYRIPLTIIIIKLCQ